MAPDLLAIGQVAKDISPNGHDLGGAVVYGGLAAARLGLRVAAVVGAGPDVSPSDALPGISIQAAASAATTTFRNSYLGGRRSQVIEDVGGPIGLDDVPLRWRSAPLVLLGCLTGEIAPELTGCFRDSTVLASLQGWLRHWDAAGRVSPAEWDGADVLPHVDAAIASEDDVANSRAFDRWKDMVRVLIVTRGAQGASIHFDREWHHVEAFSAHEVDPTGAGDVFAAAYLVRYRETSDPLESARFAACAASFCVEASGTLGIPGREQVDARLRA